MKELTPKKLNRTIYILIAVFLVLPILALKPAWDILDKLANSVAEEKANLYFLTEKEKVLSDLKKRYEVVQKNSDDFYKSLPETKKVSQFINSIEAIAKETSIPITDLKIEKGKIKDLSLSQTTKEENYYTLPMKITLEGDYSNFSLFLSKLENEKRYANIGILEIIKENYITVNQHIKAVLNLVIYLKP